MSKNEQGQDNIIDIKKINQNNNEKIYDLWKDQNFFEAKNINDKSILNNIYGKEIFLLIDELSKFKENSNVFMKKTDEELNIKYDHFKSEVLKYLNSTTNQIFNAFHLDLSNINEENLKIIQGFAQDKIIFLKKVITLYKQIIEIIQQNFLILKNFLQNFDLNQEYPLQDFFTKEFDNITTSWLFLKLDLEKFDFKNVIEESSLNMNYKEFLMKECHEKNSEMNIILPEIKQNSGKVADIKEKYKDKIKLISDNSSHLVKLNFTNVPVIEEFLGTVKYDNLKKLKLKNSYILNNEIFNQFSSLNKLSIKYCPNLDTYIFNNINLLNLKQLILDKNGFVNEDFDNLIVNFLLKSQDLLNNLEILSFAYNNISNIDFNHYLSTSKNVFNSLNTLVLRNNEIYRIFLDINYFPELKLLDVCNNNLTSNYFNELNNTNNNIIILQSGNFFLMDDDLCVQYYNNLQNKLSNINNCSLKYLFLSYIPTIYSSSFFNKLKINHALLINLQTLNLSYNGLSCDIFFSFIEKNKECLNLRTLNLIGNELDDTFFEKYLNFGLNKIFSNLNKLYLSDNKIGNNSEINFKDKDPISKRDFEKDIYKLRLMYQFIVENKSLKILTINKNPISEKYKVLYETDEFLNDTEIVNDKNGKIIINCFYSFLLKIKNELQDRNDFNIEFDCIYDINLNSQNYPYDRQQIVFNI
jgi:hypothetical protein